MDAEFVAKELLVAFLGTTQLVPEHEGKKTGEYIGDIYIALVEKVRQAKKGA